MSLAAASRYAAWAASNASCAGQRAIRIAISVQDQQRPSCEQADHARAIELVERTGNDLVPQLATDTGIDLGLAKILCRRFVRGLNRGGSAVPRLVLEAPTEALYANRGNGDLDAIIDGRRQPRLDPSQY